MCITKKLALVLFSAALACVWSSHALAEPELTHTRLFENHDKVVYRIPALAISTKGTLLAVCNARVGSPSDNCPYIRLLLRRSTDDGKTWKFEPRIIDTKGYHGCSTVGSDTGIVVRSGKNKGRLLMAARAGIDQRVAYEFCRKNGLLMPPPNGGNRVGQNCAIYSDDHGKTWTAGGTVQPQTGESFGDFAVSALPDCNYGTAASVLSVPKEVHGRHFVLFTNPTYNEFGHSVLRNRKRFTASVSFDDTKTWPLKKLVNFGPSGYSASVMNKDGEFVVLYEKGEHHYRDTGVSIVKFNLEWLLDGKALEDF